MYEDTDLFDGPGCPSGEDGDGVGGGVVTPVITVTNDQNSGGENVTIIFHGVEVRSVCVCHVFYSKFSTTVNILLDTLHAIMLCVYHCQIAAGDEAVCARWNAALNCKHCWLISCGTS